MISGKATRFLFGGVEVGKIQRFQFFGGQPVDVAHRALNGDAVEYQPGLPDYGIIRINLMLDLDDLGQAAMRDSLAARIVEPCQLVYDDGKTMDLDAYCRAFPVEGGKETKQPIKTVATLRISGPVTEGS